MYRWVKNPRECGNSRVNKLAKYAILELIFLVPKAKDGKLKISRPHFINPGLVPVLKLPPLFRRLWMNFEQRPCKHIATFKIVFKSLQKTTIKYAWKMPKNGYARN